MREAEGGRRQAENLVPAQYQPPLPLDRLILPDGSPGAGDRTEFDVLIVGAGPAGLGLPRVLARVARGGGQAPKSGQLLKGAPLVLDSLAGRGVDTRAHRRVVPPPPDADCPRPAPR